MSAGTCTEQALVASRSRVHRAHVEMTSPLAYMTTCAITSLSPLHTCAAAGAFAQHSAHQYAAPGHHPTMGATTGTQARPQPRPWGADPTTQPRPCRSTPAQPSGRLRSRPTMDLRTGPEHNHGHSEPTTDPTTGQTTAPPPPNHRPDHAGQRPAQAMRNGCTTGRSLRINRSQLPPRSLRTPHQRAPSMVDRDGLRSGRTAAAQPSRPITQPPQSRLRRPGPAIAHAQALVADVVDHPLATRKPASLTRFQVENGRPCSTGLDLRLAGGARTRSRPTSGFVAFQPGQDQGLLGADTSSAPGTLR